MENKEDIEGLDSSPDFLGDYPIDAVLIRSEPRTVHDIIRRMRADSYILDPDFQRDFVWPLQKQSKLIESALMRIPLPVFYLAERDDGKIVVVDGLQRLTTFYRFLENKFALQDIGQAGTLNGKYFRDLPTKLQNRIEDTNLILYLIDQKVPEQAKLDIFERVNSGVPLTRQQMRNSMYVGPGTRWLKATARSKAFLRATDETLDSKTMRDRECINRFCGFLLLGPDCYRGDMDWFLAETLRKMNAMPSSDLDTLLQSFERSMRNNSVIFGKHAFRKHRSFTGPKDRRSPLNVALFDVCSVLLAGIDEAVAASHKTSYQEKFFSLMDNQEFLNAISISTNSTKPVQKRFELASKAFAEVTTHVDKSHTKSV